MNDKYSSTRGEFKLNGYKNASVKQNCFVEARKVKIDTDLIDFDLVIHPACRQPNGGAACYAETDSSPKLW